MYHRNFTSEKVSEDDLILACKRAAVYDTITNFPEGFDTKVAYKSRTLSGGQKQRLAIARALVGLVHEKKPLLLLDEATSALDNETESLVMQGLGEAAKEHNFTMVSIAHRLSTIRYCDKILLLDQGVVLESGSHEELIKQGKEYKKRWELFVAATS